MRYFKLKIILAVFALPVLSSAMGILGAYLGFRLAFYVLLCLGKFLIWSTGNKDWIDIMWLMMIVGPIAAIIGFSGFLVLTWFSISYWIDRLDPSAERRGFPIQPESTQIDKIKTNQGKSSE